jgi:quinol monooxygenase YgiN
MATALGHFKLKNKKQLFKFLRMSKKIEQQALSANGNINVKFIGGELTSFYVSSKWQSMAAMKEFSKSGFHLEAINQASELSSEIRLLYFPFLADLSELEVKSLLASDNRVRILKFP